MTAILSHIAIESGNHPQYSIIWLHGLGADGQDFVPIVDELQLPCPVRYIFPHAPKRPVTINSGLIMRAWYDITEDELASSLDNALTKRQPVTPQDEAGIRASQQAIEALIAQEVARGINPDHIFLAGFSQGGAIALQTALRQSVPLAGVLALSTYLPLTETIHSEATAQSKHTPIFMAHGLNDPIVPCSMGIASRETLLSQGYRIEWHEYAMQHTVNEKELRDIENWLTKQIGV